MSWHRTDTRGLEPLGIIDIGSNSVRLVVFEGAIRAPAPLFNEKVSCGLGRKVASTGRMGDEAVDRALAALRRFAEIARVLEVKNLRAIATAAVREADDGADFISLGEQILGTSIQILSGEREAQLAAHGIMMGFRDADGIAGDLGGGSLELIDIKKSKLRQATTLPLGGLRLIDSAGGNIGRALELADDSLDKVDWLEGGQRRSFYAVGGTWRSLAKLHMAMTDYPLRVMHDYALPLREAVDLCVMIRKDKKLQAVDGIELISKARREVLPYGAVVLERLLKRLKPRDVVFSVFGIREGLLYSLLLPSEQRKDPLLSFCEDYARMRSRSLAQAIELCRWTDAIFRKPGPDETDEEQRLRHAACLISDIAWRVHPDYRSQQSLNTIAHGALGGIDHPGRVFVALAVYVRHEGLGRTAGEADGLPERLRSIVSKRTLKRARIVGAAIRVAHMISLGRPRILDEAPIRYVDGNLELTLPRQYANLDGERLRRRLRALAGLLDSGSEVVVER